MWSAPSVCVTRSFDNAGLELEKVILKPFEPEVLIEAVKKLGDRAPVNSAVS
jgi:hypothetical protein